MQAALGGDHHSAGGGPRCPGDQPFAFAAAAVDVSGVEMVDAQVVTRPDRGDAVFVGDARAGHAGDRPAAQGDFGNFDAGVGKGAVIHGWEGKEGLAAR